MGVGGQCHAPGRFTSGKDPVPIGIESWLGPRAGLDGCGISRPPPGFNPRTFQPVASHYIDWAIDAHMQWITNIILLRGCAVRCLHMCLQTHPLITNLAPIPVYALPFSSSDRLWFLPVCVVRTETNTFSHIFSNSLFTNPTIPGHRLCPVARHSQMK